MVNKANNKIFLLTCYLNNYLYILYFTEPITTIIGGPDMFINKGSTMNLTCIIKHSPEPPPLIYWTHDSKF
ncbi:zwei Ig domain protein zig-8 [Aphis craccivora]|uniref:Zwei Ig domain protein zig-8 n=1 Tax=Aphis craccivora TaxID=307492 RepID=A0A6G0ZLP5_APHCR|nr:zwei Ig domain protein zig-8 [Aphis craccivora]